MTEKFLDIAPPQRIERREFKRALERERPHPIISFINKGKRVFFPLLLLVVLAGLFLSLSGRKAAVTIWPLADILRVQKEVVLKEGGSLDLASLVLPSELLEVEKTVSQTFPTSFVAQKKKAEGMIKVYNSYSTAPLTLRAQTRFLSDGGKLFKAPERLVVPGKKQEGGRWVPGVLEVRVEAAEPGEDYNISPSTFSLPGLAGTALYTLVYGESEEAMRGGFSGRGHQLLAEDLETAEEVLRKKVAGEGFQDIINKAGQGRVVLEETLFYETLASSSSEEVGSLAEEFTLTLRFKAKAFSFQKEDLDKMVREILEGQLPKGRRLWEEGLKLSWEMREVSSVAPEGRGAKQEEPVLALKVSVPVYEEVDLRGLKDSLAGKSRSEALFLLKNQFEKAEIKIFPFWLKKIPQDPQRVEVVIKLEINGVGG